MNCKKGDLAIIIKSSCGNEGKIVEVVEWYAAGAYPHGEYNNYHAGWLVRSPSGLRNINLLGDFIGESAEGVIPDAWLRPVSGLPSPEELIREKELEDA